MTVICSLILLYAITSVVATRAGRAESVPSTSRTPHDQSVQIGPGLQTREGVVELPLQRSARKRVARRDEVEDGKAAIGLGDALDITYNVLVQVGEVFTPLVLDTGSADLWVLSDNCSLCADAPYPLYKSQNFSSVADARLLYGDSRTGTHAFGRIGADRAGVAGLVLERQYFAAINATNTSVLDTGSTGIFGLGFPVNSILWNELYTIAASNSSSLISKRQHPARIDLYSQPRTLPSLPPTPLVRNLAVDDNVTTPGSASNSVEILPAFSTYGPLVCRLVLDDDDSQISRRLVSTQFTVTLQRTIPAPGGNVGLLTLGGLPDGVDNTSLTWASVRRYTEEQNGLVVPQAPEESYPYAWEIPLDAVYFDGVRLPDSTRGDVLKVGVGHSTLIDTGNSLIRGPADVIIAILSLLLNGTSSLSPFASPPPLDVSSYSEEEYADFTESYDSIAYAYPCAEAHSLAFEFSGQRFQVDPRDFGRPIGDEEARWCVPNLAPTDPPFLGGYLYSWSLGEPFLRGILASFYYGNLTHPSSDPPRIGFLSTVPSDATLRLAFAVESAQGVGRYPETTVAAPTGTHTDIAITTNSQGVVQASEPPLPSDLASSADSGQRRQGSGASCLLCSAFGAEFRLENDSLICMLLILVATAMFA